jgi:hypothetical protein
VEIETWAGTSGQEVSSMAVWPGDGHDTASSGGAVSMGMRRRAVAMAIGYWVGLGQCSLHGEKKCQGGVG